MTKETTFYICEVCNSEYRKKEEALRCEISGIEDPIALPVVLEIPSRENDTFLLLNSKKINRRLGIEGKHTHAYSGRYLQGINTQLEVPSEGFNSSFSMSVQDVILRKTGETYEISGAIIVQWAKILSQEEITKICTWNKDLETLLEETK